MDAKIDNSNQTEMTPHYVTPKSISNTPERKLISAPGKYRYAWLIHNLNIASTRPTCLVSKPKSRKITILREAKMTILAENTLARQTLLLLHLS